MPADTAQTTDAVADEPEKTLALADELFTKGSKAIEEDNLVDAVDCLSRALEIRVAHYGELAPECANTYYKYGAALLFKAQEEADPLGNVPKDSSKISASNVTSKCASSKGSSGKGEDSGKKDEEETDGENEGEDDDLAEDADGEEEETDLDMAWTMLDIARAIDEKNPEDTLDRVKILSSLGEVSLEREEFETSLSDYKKALSVAEKLFEADHRRVIELNFRIGMVLEVASRTEEAVPYCEKAVDLCKSRLTRLTEEFIKTKGLSAVMRDVGSSSNLKEGVNKSSDDVHSEREEEVELLRGFLGELEKKLEDIHHAIANPKPVLAEIMKMASAKLAQGGSKDVECKSPSLNSSQIGEVSGAFDSPAVSTAATNGTVTHLGVVGRGVKRASIAPIPADPAPKKPALDT